MLKWEYRRVEAVYDSKSNSYKVVGASERDYLNSMGRDGWDLVSHQDVALANPSGWLMQGWHSYLFKRPVE